MRMMKNTSQTNAESAPTEVVVESRQQPAWHVVVLGIFTCGWYLPWWAYKTYRDLQREALEVHGPQMDDAAREAGIAPPELAPLPQRRPDVHSDAETSEALLTFARVNPWLRALGIAVPVLDIYLLATLSISICNLSPRQSSFPHRKPLIATLLVVGAYLGLRALSRLPEGWFAISFLSLVPIAFLQHWLNEYWVSVERDSLLVRHGFNMWELIVIIIGAGLLGLGASGLMIGIKI